MRRVLLTAAVSLACILSGRSVVAQPLPTEIHEWYQATDWGNFGFHEYEFVGTHHAEIWFGFKKIDISPASGRGVIVFTLLSIPSLLLLSLWYGTRRRRAAQVENRG